MDCFHSLGSTWNTRATITCEKKAKGPGKTLHPMGQIQGGLVVTPSHLPLRYGEEEKVGKNNGRSEQRL